MHKTILFEILQKLGSMSTYSELLPSEFESKYLNDLDDLKKKINELKKIFSESQETIKKVDTEKTKEVVINKPVEKQEISLSSEESKQKTESNKKQTFSLFPSDFFNNNKSNESQINLNEELLSPVEKPKLVPELQISFEPTKIEPPKLEPTKIEKPSLLPLNVFENPKEPLEVQISEKKENVPIAKPPKVQAPPKATFSGITSILIPKLTKEGKNVMGDLSLNIEIYRALKLIDGNSSLNQLYKSHAHNYKNFIDFASLLYQLELDKFISFVKTQKNVPFRGWVKIGEILSEGNVISDFNVSKALNYQKEKRGKFLGELMLELKMLDEDLLRNSLKIQRWLSKLSENSIYFSPETEKTQISKQFEKVIDESFYNVFDFIVPIFSEKAKSILNDSKYIDLSSKLKIIDGKSTLLKIYEDNKESFNNDTLSFLKFIFKLEAQEFLLYIKNNSVLERNIWIKYGELLISLGLIDEKQLEQAMNTRAGNEKMKNKYLGEVLAELNFITTDILQETLKIQRWCNAVLAKISYENAFVSGIESVLKTTFNCPVEIGSSRRMAFTKPLEGMVLIIYPIKGKLNGYVYYILDHLFIHNLSKTLMASYGMSLGESDKIDESIISEISSMITGSSLTKLSNIGLACETSLPKISLEKEIIIADKKIISVIPLMNQWGRFAIGLEINN